MARRLRIRIKRTGDWDKLKKFTDELSGRVKAAKRALMEQRATEFLKNLSLSFIPAGEWPNLYKQALKVVEITNLPSGIDTMFAVVAEKRAAFHTLDAEITLVSLFPSPGTSFAEWNAAVKFNPWTVDTLPALTGGVSIYRARGGEVVARQASKNEVATRRNELHKLLPKIGRAYADERLKFDRLGVAKTEKQVILDLAFFAARLEFGFGGFRPTPHWKPAILQAKKQAEAFARNPDKLLDLPTEGIVGTIAAILNPDLDNWKKILKRDVETIPLAVVKEFDKFGAMIGAL